MLKKPEKIQSSGEICCTTCGRSRATEIAKVNKAIEDCEAYYKHEIDKKDAEIASLVQEVNSAFKQGNYEGYKEGFENGQNDERSN